MSLGCFPKTK